jgi:hypothetical protein
MSDVRRLIYSLGLHLPNPPGSPSLIDLEIGRRLFWEAYAIDKYVLKYLVRQNSLS